MAEKRMFAKTIIDSDAFMDMPLSTQALYFHLSMRADDDGFVNNPKKVQRMIGCGDDDMKLLLAKSFLIGFDSGVVVVTHWKLHNYISKDRYKETTYQTEKAMLALEKNKTYTLMSTSCIQSVDNLCTQIRLDKNRLDESSIDESSVEEITTTTEEEEEWHRTFSPMQSVSTMMCGQIQTTVDNFRLVQAFVTDIMQRYWHRAPNEWDMEHAFANLYRDTPTEDGAIVHMYNEDKAGMLEQAFELSSRKGPETMNWNYINAIYDHWEHKGFMNQFQVYLHEHERNKMKELNYL